MTQVELLTEIRDLLLHIDRVLQYAFVVLVLAVIWFCFRRITYFLDSFF